MCVNYAEWTISSLLQRFQQRRFGGDGPSTAASLKMRWPSYFGVFMLFIHIVNMLCCLEFYLIYFFCYYLAYFICETRSVLVVTAQHIFEIAKFSVGLYVSLFFFSFSP